MALSEQDSFSRCPLPARCRRCHAFREGPLTEAIAGAQLGRRELVLMPTTAVQVRADSALTAARVFVYGPTKAVNWAKRESAAARAASGAVIVTDISSGCSSNSKVRKLQQACS